MIVLVAISKGMQMVKLSSNKIPELFTYPVLAGTLSHSVESWRIFLEQSFTTCMPLLVVELRVLLQ